MEKIMSLGEIFAHLHNNPEEYTLTPDPLEDTDDLGVCEDENDTCDYEDDDPMEDDDPFQADDTLERVDDDELRVPIRFPHKNHQ